jgi:hypothetical protein
VCSTCVEEFRKWFKGKKEEGILVYLCSGWNPEITSTNATFIFKRSKIAPLYCSFNLVVGRKILWYFKLKILRGL